MYIFDFTYNWSFLWGDESYLVICFYFHNLILKLNINEVIVKVYIKQICIESFSINVEEEFDGFPFL